MSWRIAPLWWPLLAAATPLLVPWVALRQRTFGAQRRLARRLNTERLASIEPRELEPLDELELTVLVDWRAAPGFGGDEAVSYRLRSDRGALLFDIAFGAARPTLARNSASLGFGLDQIDGVVISHLHPDHMGGLSAHRAREVRLPPAWGRRPALPCFLPDRAGARDLEPVLVQGPTTLPGGFCSTGPLARALFFLGLTEEQALVAHLAGKGLVLVTGCGHPTVELLLSVVERLSGEPLYAIAGGLHFPITAGRGRPPGIEMQSIVGTGKPPWHRVNDEDLTAAIARINRAAPRRVLLSAHDTCDHALQRMERELDARVEVLEAGRSYRI
jgi:7,8-dihydropterin-6-yl-methyl-4-(beta-D-ribofuranosyl)aminobenzene 5'-phosphate synthase